MTRGKLLEKTAIVTGASSGIGRGIAKRFGEEGATVVNADIRRYPRDGTLSDENSASPTDEVINRDLSGDSVYIETDVSDPASVRDTITQTVDEFGGIDILVNNAGIDKPGTTQDISLEDWHHIIDVNLHGAFYCAKFAVPELVNSEGTIINIASVMATEGGNGPPYSSSKGGLLNLTRDMAVELGPESINVNAICPGYIKTATHDRSDNDLDKALKQTLLPRLGAPKDIGDAAVFLAHSESDFIHGTAIYVDGGWSAHRSALWF